MSKKIFISLSLCFLFFFVQLTIESVSAVTCPTTISQGQFPNDFNGVVAISTQESCIRSGTTYLIDAYPQQHEGRIENHTYETKQAIADDSITFNFNLNPVNTPRLGQIYPGSWIIRVCRTSGVPSNCNQNNIVSSINISVLSGPTPTTPPDLPIIKPQDQQQCRFQVGSIVNLKVTNISPNRTYQWWWNEGIIQAAQDTITSDATGSDLNIAVPSDKTQDVGDKKLCIDISNINEPSRRIGQNCINIKFEATPPSGDTSCQSLAQPSPATNQPCKPTTAPGFSSGDKACTSGGGISCGADGIATAIGCIHTQPTALVKDLLKFLIGIAGGIAFLLMVLGAFEMITSAGNPESLQAGKDRFTQAIIGLLFVVFSVLLLQLIGLDILGIPGFGR